MTFWAGRTGRKEYPCPPIPATCTLLHQLATTVRWSDVEQVCNQRPQRASI